MFMLPPVQVLVDVQALCGPSVCVGLWQMLPVVPLLLTLRVYSVYSPHSNLAFAYAMPHQSLSKDSHLYPLPRRVLGQLYLPIYRCHTCYWPFLATSP